MNGIDTDLPSVSEIRNIVASNIITNGKTVIYGRAMKQQFDDTSPDTVAVAVGTSLVAIYFAAGMVAGMIGKDKPAPVDPTAPRAPAVSTQQASPTFK